MSDQKNEILRVKQVAHKMGISVSTVWCKVNPKNRRYDAAFPKPFKIADNATGWLASEVNNHIEKLASQRQGVANEAQCQRHCIQ